MASRISQDVVEALVASLGANSRISQDVVEAVVLPQHAKVSQEVVEAVVAPANPNARITQEVVEAIVGTVAANARITQEVLEVVQPFLPSEEPNEWVVEAFPRIEWDGFAEDPWSPDGEWRVRSRPRIDWGATVLTPATAWTVEPTPRAIWKTGPGTASTECISGDGIVPPPEEEPVDSGEQNYVF